MAIGLRKGQSSKGLENPRKQMSGKTEKTWFKSIKFFSFFCS